MNTVNTTASVPRGHVGQPPFLSDEVWGTLLALWTADRGTVPERRVIACGARQRQPRMRGAG